MTWSSRFTSRKFYFERNRNKPRNVERALQPRIETSSDDIGCSKSERGGDCNTSTLESRASLDSNTEEMCESTASRRPLQPSLGSSIRMSFSPPQEGGSGLQESVDGKRFASLSQQTQVCGARETRSRKTFFEREDHPLTDVSVCRNAVAEVVKAVRGQSDCFALSARQ